MDIDIQAIKLYLLPLFLIATIKNVAGSIGHGPGLVPVPVVVGWTKYVPQNVPPHAWTTTYLNTGLKVLPPPPYYTPAYPQPVIPVTQPIVPVGPAITPVAPVLPPPTFSSNPPLLPAPTFNTNVPVFPTFNGNTPVFRTPIPAQIPAPVPKPEDPLTFPVATNPQPVVPDSDNGPQPPANFGAPSGYPVSGNYLSPVVAYPGRYRGPPLRPFISTGRIPRPSYSVSENHELEHTYGPPPGPYAVSPYPPKYRPAPSETYGPPSFNENREPLYREYSSRPPVSHIVRVVRPVSRYSSAELFR